MTKLEATARMIVCFLGMACAYILGAMRRNKHAVA